MKNYNKKNLKDKIFWQQCSKRNTEWTLFYNACEGVTQNDQFQKGCVHYIEKQW